MEEKIIPPDTTGYATKDSGQHQEFPTGARRDSQAGKGRYDLIPPQFLRELALALEGPAGSDRNVLLGLCLIPMRPLLRLAALYGRGAAKYGPSNWLRGIPLSRTLDSMLRHAFGWASGRDDEDHLSAVAWNAFTLAETEARVVEGVLPDPLADVGPRVSTGSSTLWEWIDEILLGDPGKKVV